MKYLGNWIVAVQNVINRCKSFFVIKSDLDATQRYSDFILGYCLICIGFFFTRVLYKIALILCSDLAVC